jgi:hypothetical protein
MTLVLMERDVTLPCVWRFATQTSTASEEKSVYRDHAKPVAELTATAGSMRNVWEVSVSVNLAIHLEQQDALILMNVLADHLATPQLTVSTIQDHSNVSVLKGLLETKRQDHVTNQMNVKLMTNAMQTWPVERMQTRYWNAWILAELFQTLVVRTQSVKLAITLLYASAWMALLVNQPILGLDVRRSSVSTTTDVLVTNTATSTYSNVRILAPVRTVAKESAEV